MREASPRPAERSAIDWLHQHHQIGDDTFEAGLIYEWLLRQAQGNPVRASAGAQPRGPRGSVREPIGAVEARLTLAKVAEDLGPYLQRVITMIVAEGCAIRRLEYDLSLPVRSGKVVVQIALDQLTRSLFRHKAFVGAQVHA